MPSGRGQRGRRRTGPGRFADAVMVVHGPEAFDRGDVALLQDLLGPGETVVAGVMARTAAEESGLPVIIDGGIPSSVIGRIPGPEGNRDRPGGKRAPLERIPGPEGRPGAEGAGAVSGRRRREAAPPVQGGRGPSGPGKGASLDRTERRVFLVNRGKTPESGRIFGEIVASRLPRGRPLVQLECSSRTVFLWNGSGRSREFARLLAGETGFSFTETTAGREEESAEREIRGCIPGEAVLVEGIVIGTATAGTVVLRKSEGRIRVVSGLRPKAHGLEKLSRLGDIDLGRAWCKSGRIRGVPPRAGGPAPAAGRVVVIDHRGHDLYRFLTPDTCGVLAIGDDTTSVCGHICSHLGIPVFGVVDGDRDDLLVSSFPPGSVIAEVSGGSDDEAGRELAGHNQDEIIAWEDWVARALAILGNRCRVIHQVPAPAGEPQKKKG
ncbi:MAG: DUF2117 domain-containing protein [Methanomicrobiales archaeon]